MRHIRIEYRSQKTEFRIQTSLFRLDESFFVRVSIQNLYVSKNNHVLFYLSSQSC